MTAASEPRVIKQGRPGVIVLIALVVELVAILSLANQVVAKHLTSYSKHHPYAFPGRLALAGTVYRWQVNAQPGDRANELLAHLCLDVVVLVLTGLLVYVLTRGPVTFLRAFFGTWLTVIVATLLGMIVFALVSPPSYPAHLSHVTGAVFLVPNGYGLVGGAVLGFVTALFAAIFAVATRRIIRLTPAYEPASSGGYRDEPSDWNDQTMAYPRGGYGASSEPENAGYGGYGSGGGYGSSQSGGYPATPGSGYAGAAVGGYGGYYGSQVGAPGGERGTESDTGADATQSLRPVEEPTQAMEPPTGASVPSTSEPAAEQADSQSGEAQSAEAQSAEAQPAEAQPAEAQPAEAQPDLGATQQFPRPPDDEDLGQNPDHHDL